MLKKLKAFSDFLKKHRRVTFYTLITLSFVLNIPMLMKVIDHSNARSMHVNEAAMAKVEAAKAAEAENKSPAEKELLEMEKSDEPWLSNEQNVSAMVADIRNHNVLAVTISAGNILISTKSNNRYFVSDNGFSDTGRSILFREYIALDSENLFALKTKSMLSTEPPKKQSVNWLVTAGMVVSLILPLLLIIIIVYFVVMNFKKGIRLAEKPSIRFSDVIGANEAKSSFSDIISYMNNPAAFAEMGVKPPRGILLSGSPGVGKTLLAKALAGECGANFISVTGGHFSSMFYGAGIAKVKSLFAQARKNAPCIVFIDEIDGIGKRLAQQHASDSEVNRIINQVLAEMDGFDTKEGVIVIGATNHTNSIDEALLREGRFDRKIQVALPSLDERVELFKFYSQKIKTETNIDFDQLARLSIGLAPVTIAHAINHAALMALKNGRDKVSMSDLLESLDVSRMGEAKVLYRPMREDDRSRIAVHEAGHAILAKHLKSGVVERVTILPRGGALGVTLVTQEDDISLYSEQMLRNRILMLLGGRNAERLVLGNISSGASGDIEEASRIAYGMVAMYGMDKDILFSAKMAADMRISHDSADYMNRANLLLKELDAECFELLKKLRTPLEEIMRSLLEHETIEGVVVNNALESFYQQDPILEQVDQKLPKSN